VHRQQAGHRLQCPLALPEPSLGHARPLPAILNPRPGGGGEGRASSFLKWLSRLSLGHLMGGTGMRRLMLSLFSLTALLAPQTAFAGQPAVGVVTNFGPNLATVCPMPEGIAVDPTGNLYASSFA